MRKSRFTEEQMVKILREADIGSVAEVAKRHAVSEQTIYAWCKRYGELEVSDVRRLRELEQENARLKRLVAERDLEIDVMCGGERRCSAHTGLLRRRARVIAAPHLLPL